MFNKYNALNMLHFKYNIVQASRRGGGMALVKVNRIFIIKQ